MCQNAIRAGSGLTSASSPFVLQIMIEFCPGGAVDATMLGRLSLSWFVFFVFVPCVFSEVFHLLSGGLGEPGSTPAAVLQLLFSPWG